MEGHPPPTAPALKRPRTWSVNDAGDVDQISDSWNYIFISCVRIRKNVIYLPFPNLMLAHQKKMWAMWARTKARTYFDFTKLRRANKFTNLQQNTNLEIKLFTTVTSKRCEMEHQ